MACSFIDLAAICSANLSALRPVLLDSVLRTCPHLFETFCVFNHLHDTNNGQTISVTQFDTEPTDPLGAASCAIFSYISPLRRLKAALPNEKPPCLLRPQSIRGDPGERNVRMANVRNYAAPPPKMCFAMFTEFLPVPVLPCDKSPSLAKDRS